MSRYPLAERPYEGLFIVPTDTVQTDIDALTDKIKAIVVKENGTMRSVQNWGRRRLVYPIKRQKDGVYIYFDFNGSPSIPAQLNSLFRVTDSVVRQMVVERVDAPVAPVVESAPVSAEKPQDVAAPQPEAPAR